MAPTAKLTKLQAVNAVLTNAGYVPVSVLSSSGPQVAVHAQQILSEHTAAVCSDGWWFNRDYSVLLQRDGDDKIPTPPDAIDVDLEDGGATVERDGFLYNVVTNTDIFTSDAYATVTYLREFEDLPRPAQDYIVARCRTEFQETRVGDQNITRLNTAREIDARRRLTGMESRNTDANIVSGVRHLRNTVLRGDRIGFSGGSVSSINNGGLG